MDRREVLNRFAERLGYSEEEAGLVAGDRTRTRFAEALAKAGNEYLIVAEVLSAANCNSGYRRGDRFVLDAAGNFMAKRCPAGMCVYLVSQMALPVALINERFCAGLEPGDIHFMRQLQCLDAGVRCKGYGSVAVEMKAMSRREFLRQVKAGS